MAVFYNVLLGVLLGFISWVVMFGIIVAGHTSYGNKPLDKGDWRFIIKALYIMLIGGMILGLLTKGA